MGTILSDAETFRVRHSILIVSVILLFHFFLPAQICCAAQQGWAAQTGDIEQSLEQDGRRREYLLHLPSGYDGSRKLPLLIMLHGGGGNYRFLIKMSKMSSVADRNGFIVAYPNGSGRLNQIGLTWNAGDCCGYARGHRIDDLGFLKALIDRLCSQYSIDESRIYIAGFSNGGMMAYEASCAMSDRLAAIAVVGGSMTGRECRPSRPMPVIIFHGTADRHVPYDGGPGKLAKWGYAVNRKSVRYAVDFWVEQNGCSKESEKVKVRDVVAEKYTGGKNGSAVVLYTVEGGGHAWPGGERAWFRADQPTTQISASELIWDFFSHRSRVK